MNRNDYFFDGDIFECRCRKHDEYQCMDCIDDMLVKMGKEVAAAETALDILRKELIGELRSLKTLASLTGSLATVKYCDERLAVLVQEKQQ